MVSRFLHANEVSRLPCLRSSWSRRSLAASVSPDGTTMLVVGDTNDVFLYEIRGGGREFNKIARYEGSRDAGFSTSWSADGRKFVVASQDGQVTVWDHRYASFDRNP
jgi:Tol biopolymer transport system component